MVITEPSVAPVIAPRAIGVVQIAEFYGLFDALMKCQADLAVKKSQGAHIVSKCWLVMPVEAFYQYQWL